MTIKWHETEGKASRKQGGLIHVGKWASLWRGGRLARATTYKNKRSEGSKYLRDSHVSTSFLET